MCLSKVYIEKNGVEKLISESVCNIILKDQEITLCDIIGQTSTVRGTIQDVDLMKNKVLISAEQTDADIVPDREEKADAGKLKTEHPDNRAISNRLAKVIGHLEAIRGMVDRGEDCSQILIQLAAARSAVNSAGKAVLLNHLNYCVLDAVRACDKKTIDDFTMALKQFVK